MFYSAENVLYCIPAHTTSCCMKFLTNNILFNLLSVFFFIKCEYKNSNFNNEYEKHRKYKILVAVNPT